MAQALHLQFDGLSGKFIATTCAAHEDYLLLQGTLGGGVI
jgi:hypothetical protein